MRIHYLWGGRLPSQLANAVHVLKMCEGIAALEHDVTLYHSSSASWSEQDEPAIFAQYGINRPLALENVPSGPGLRRHLFGLRLALISRRAAPDLAFSRFLPAGAWAALLGVPVIQELHVPPESASARWYLNVLLRARGFRKLVVITQALKQELQRLIPDCYWKDILVEADGVNVDEYRDTELAPPTDILALGARRPLVGYVGSLHPGKGAELIPAIAKRVPDAQFVVVGGPDEIAADYRRQAAAERISNVAWLGYRPNVDVPRYIRSCDVVLLPNQPKVVLLGRQDIGRWTSPLKVFEYMAAGKIIVASNLPVLTEVLSEDNAVLCEPSDVSQWAHEIARIASGEVDYTARAAKARSDVEQYAWPKRASRCIAAAAIGQ